MKKTITILILMTALSLYPMYSYAHNWQKVADIIYTLANSGTSPAYIHQIQRSISNIPSGYLSSYYGGEIQYYRNLIYHYERCYRPRPYHPIIRWYKPNHRIHHHHRIHSCYYRY